MKVELLLFLLHCVSCVVCFPSVLKRGGCPSIYTQRRGDATAIPGMKLMHHRLLNGGMQPPHEGEDKRCQVGAAEPRGRPALDWLPSPPPSHGGSVSAPGPLLRWYYILNWWTFLFILCAIQCWKAPFSVFSRVFVYMSCKNNNLPNTSGTRSVVNAYLFKFVNFSPFYVLIGGRIWSLRTANKLPHT